MSDLFLNYEPKWALIMTTDELFYCQVSPGGSQENIAGSTHIIRNSVTIVRVHFTSLV